MHEASARLCSISKETNQAPPYIIIMLIRPQQALLLARIYCKLFVFKSIFQI